jgi:predicted RNA methylase
MQMVLRTVLYALAVGTLSAGPVVAQDVAPAHTETVKPIMDSQSFKMAVDALQKDHERWIGKVIKLTEIPAPPFEEQERSKAYAEMLKAHGLSDVEIDAEGNAIGVRKGTGGGPLVVVSAHLGTVFPEGTDVKVKR